MTADAAISAIAPVEASAKPPATDVNTDVAAQQVMAKNFDVSLSQSAERAAMQAQTFEESHWKTIQIERERGLVQTPEAGNHKDADTGGFKEGFVQYMQNFQHKTENTFGNLGNTGNMSLSDMLMMQVKVSEWSIECQMLSSVSSHATGMINNLMKGQ